MKYWVLAVIVTITMTPIFAADLETGLLAYERKDFKTALAQLMQLAEAGDPDAQFMLGRMFVRGEGVLQDFVEAHKWYNLAASRGQRLAAPARDVTAENMAAEQIAKAQELARQWRPIGGGQLRFESLIPPADPAISASEPAAEVEPEVDLGPSESTIAMIQLQLKQLGYPVGSVDGRLGEATSASIRDYQAAYGLGIDGQPSKKLLRHMVTRQRAHPSRRRTPKQSGKSGVWRELM